MAYEKQYKIVDSIIVKSANNELEWEKTFDDNTFQVTLNNHSIRFSEVENFTSPDEYIISIVNKLGDVIERVDAQELDEDMNRFRPQNKKSYRMKLKETFSLIKRKANGIEEALDEVIQELENDKFSI